MDEICFEVKGLPPKKGADFSMWGEKMTDEKGRLNELRKTKGLIELRRKAAKAMCGQTPFKGKIGLTLEIHLARKKGGDLDTFVAGVCDGLMRAPNKVKKFSSQWAGQPPEIGPDRAIVYKDDDQVVSINATKKADASKGNERYTVKVSSIKDA